MALSNRRVLGFTVALTLFLAVVATWNKEWLYPYVALALPLDEPPAATIPELRLDRTISLGTATGRIDHLAIDTAEKRLFIAELGNNSVSVVDLRNNLVQTRKSGFKEPQGIAFVPEADTVFIANGDNGVVDIRRAADLSLVKQVTLGDDADNIRADMEGRIIIGYGDGGLAMLDPSTGEKLGDIRLASHPEGFALDADTNRAFVNEPKALRIGVIDRRSGKEIARWGASGAAANFPMAYDADSHLLFVAYRIPALITAFDTKTGELVARLPTGGDADDIYYDKARSRLYVICGDGLIDVLAVSGHHLQELSRLATRPGARTGIYAPDLDLLFVAAPATKAAAAEIQIYRPH